MKKIYALISITIMLFCACQKTPENPVVVNKANGELEKKIMQTATPSPSTAPEETPVPLENVKRSFSAKDEKVEITVDAQVFIPEGNLPVVVIEPDEISLDFVQKAAEVLLEGKPLYEPRTQMTKSEIDEKILELQLALANPEESKSDGLRSGDPDTVTEVTKMFEDRIKIYQGMLEDAPDEYTPKTAVMEFKPSKYYENEQRYKENVADWSDDGSGQAKQLLRQYDEEMKIVLDADLDGGYYGRITANNFIGDLSRWNRLSFIKSKTLNQNTFEPNFDYRATVHAGISSQEAQRKMEKLVADLGLYGMVMTYFYEDTDKKWDKDWNLIEENTVGYLGIFQREYQGIAALNNVRMFNTVNEKHYRPIYQRESIEIRIYEDEVVSFNWQNPVREVRTENDNVMIMPFADIMDIFERQMSLIYNIEKLSRDAPENRRHEELIKSIEKGSIEISSIKLGMARIPVENEMDKYRMIPVWRFFGCEYLAIKGQEAEITNMPMRAGDMVYLTLNAIDGSIVDYQSGY